MSELDSEGVFDSYSVFGHENLSDDNDDSYKEGSLMEKGNNGVDPLDTLDNVFFEGHFFSRWCEFSPCAEYFSEDDGPCVISSMVFGEVKGVKMDVTDLDSYHHIDSCDKMFWIIQNCLHLEKLIIHDNLGQFGIQKLFSLWEKPNKLRCEKLDKFEIHCTDYCRQIEGKDFFVSFLVSNIKFVKELKLIGSNFGDLTALEFSEKNLKENQLVKQNSPLWMTKLLPLD